MSTEDLALIMHDPIRKQSDNAKTSKGRIVTMHDPNRKHIDMAMTIVDFASTKP